MSESQVAGLASWMGLADYHSLWFRAGKTGTPANLGSMIVDREAQMAALCGE